MYVLGSPLPQCYDRELAPGGASFFFIFLVLIWVFLKKEMNTV